MNGDKKMEKMTQDLRIDMCFNKDFIPSQSHRNASKSIYNSRGQIRASGLDVCDCLDNSCIGCHFPCPKCKSPKCGRECRNNRNDYVCSIRTDNHTDDIRMNLNFEIFGKIKKNVEK